MTKDEKYKKVCSLWISNQTWTLEDALSIINGELPECHKDSKVEPDKDEKKAMRVLRVLVRNNLNGSIKLHPPTPGENPETIRINPIEFIEWLEEMMPGSLPHQLIDAKNNHQREKTSSSRKQRPEQIDKYRVQALAEYLWSIEPKKTKVEMSQNPELLKYGCINSNYTSETIQRWIREANPNRQPGRRS